MVRRDLQAGRVLEMEIPSRNRVEAGRYDRVLAELKFERAGEGLPVVDGPAAPLEPATGEGGQERTRAGLPDSGGRPPSKGRPHARS
ncbi:hypothetical protein [Streptomyces sp. NPDC086989]|uniref:hypothetical protein n=1 Tax=Streptomyces sp. NPDC086989 TaxID=3365764 RepID=UPI0038308052